MTSRSHFQLSLYVFLALIISNTAGSTVPTMLSSHKLIISVPTKINDGGSSTDFATRRKNQFHDSCTCSSEPHLSDAFSFYSNQDKRMKVLLGRDQVGSAAHLTIDADESTSHHRAQLIPSSCCDSDQNTRRTRLSFEVHPSLLLTDLMRSNETGGE